MGIMGQTDIMCPLRWYSEKPHHLNNISVRNVKLEFNLEENQTNLNRGRLCKKWSGLLKNANVIKDKKSLVNVSRLKRLKRYDN